MKLSLSDREVHIARFLGQLRLKEAKGRQDPNTHHYGLNDDAEKTRRETNAAGAELVVAKMLNVFPQLIDDRLERKHDLDFRGFKLDVKQTDYNNGRLLLYQNSNSSARIYVLVTGELPQFEVAGYCFKAELLQKENLTNPGHAPCWAMRQDQLHSIEHIWNLTSAPIGVTP